MLIALGIVGAVQRDPDLPGTLDAGLARVPEMPLFRTVDADRFVNH